MDSFHIVLNPDRDRLRSFASSGRSIVVPIYVAVGDDCFPDADWDDFAAVILGWWLQRVDVLRSGRTRSVALTFMDGPYVLRLSARDEDSCLGRGCVRGKKLQERFCKTVCLTQVEEELLRAARLLLTGSARTFL